MISHWLIPRFAKQVHLRSPKRNAISGRFDHCSHNATEVSHSWIRSPIDQFVLQKLSAKGIEPNPVADRRHLIRRVYFDLIGMPPSPDEVDDFVNSADPTPTQS